MIGNVSLKTCAVICTLLLGSFSQADPPLPTMPENTKPYRVLKSSISCTSVSNVTNDPAYNAINSTLIIGKNSGSRIFNNDWNLGILTLVSNSKISVSRVDGQSFDAYDRGNTLGTLDPLDPFPRFSGITSISSAEDEGKQRVDIKIGSKTGESATPVSTQFKIVFQDNDNPNTLFVANAVYIDVATLILVVTGTDCNDFIVVGDHPNYGSTTDAKWIYFGKLEGEFNNNVALRPSGVKYDTNVINAIFRGNPTISRIDVNGKAGDDIIRIRDQITQQSVIQGGAGCDNIKGNNNKNTVYGGGAEDQDMYNIIIGGNADDVISGGWGTDYIYGGGGADRLYGSNGDDWIAGGPQDDPIVKGDSGNDHLSGGPGRDRLYGDAGIDYLYIDNLDLTYSLGEKIIPVPTETDAVEATLAVLMQRYWNDGDNSLDVPDTIDELIQTMVK